MKRSAAAVLCHLVLLSPFAGADVFSLKLENDLLSAGDDGHYTSGLEAALAFEPEPSHWLRGLAAHVPGWSGGDLSYAAYRFGHQMYTPYDIERRELQVDDRPYAALLYGGISLLGTQQLPDRRETSTLSLDLGLVGPGAGGKTLQREVHRLTGSDTPRGWRHQLRNEPFVNLGYEKRWWLQRPLGGLELEYGPSLGGAVGNLYTHLSGGAGLRLGQGLARSLGQSSVAPSPGGVPLFSTDGGFAWFVQANLEGRFVAHNLLLDGNTFRDSHSVDREKWVGDAQLGLTLLWDRWQLSFSNVWRSREFQGQDQADQFASLSLSTSL